MTVANDILIVINSGPEKRFNHYEAFTLAWVAKKYYKAKKVTIMYGPQAVVMTKKGTLAGFTLTSEVRELTASQFEGLKAEKLPIHLEQLARFEGRRHTPYKAWKLTDEDWRNREKWGRYEVAVNDMIERTSTERAPWILVEAEDKRYARIKVLESVCESLERALG